MWNHLGVGLRLEHNPCSLELLAQEPMVLNYSVLDHRHRAIAASVGVSISFFRFAVGSPTGVANAALPRGPLCFKTSSEIAELALGPQAGQLALSGNRSDPSGVVTAILQLPEALQELGRRFFRANKGNDSAHTNKARLKPG